MYDPANKPAVSGCPQTSRLVEIPYHHRLFIVDCGEQKYFARFRSYADFIGSAARGQW